MSRRDWREVVYDPEPLTITAETVAEFLERHNRPRMSAMVRGMASRLEVQAEVERRLSERIYELEPRQPAPDPNGGMRWTGD